MAGVENIIAGGMAENLQLVGTKNIMWLTERGDSKYTGKRYAAENFGQWESVCAKIRK